MKRLVSVVILLVIACVVAWQVWSSAVESGDKGVERSAGVPQGDAVPAVQIIGRRDADAAVAPPSSGSDEQILFGDLHVHSTYSTDAFLWALPLNHGKGVHPVADACDYARYCSAIDFWSITDHAEASTPLRWQRTKDAIRQCQAKSVDQSNPDLVSMLGFEWTQVGTIPSEHYGHKNVVFLGLDDDEVAARPIAASGVATNALRSNTPSFPAIIPLSDFKNREVYYDLNTFFRNISVTPECDHELPSSQLPLDCFESARYPEDLIARLHDQGLDPLVIPHGSSWGYYTPPGTTWDKQLAARHRPELFRLIEIYSGHGNSEEYRDYRNIELLPDGSARCVPAQDGFTPPCVLAGEIIRGRCLREGETENACEEKAAEARDAAANMGIAYHLAVAGEDPADWLDSGQCTDCFLPAFNHRPLTSVQYGLAISNFDELGERNDPVRFNWGFIASSDNHRARPGTGYKEVARRLNTEAAGIVDPKYRRIFIPDEPEPTSTVYRRTRAELRALAGLQMTEVERQSSFWQTGGLAAVHTKGRSREQIWDALQRRETYATSGPRMLMWFDHVDDQGDEAPMGSTVEIAEAGTFKVHAVGSFKQLPGCPEYAVMALGEQRIADLCASECYNPGEERNLIERIEIVRIRPQIRADEEVGDLIDDPFLVHECAPDQNGCTFEFTDPGFSGAGRNALYYARAIQEPRPTINGEPIKCERDEEGNCIKATLCRGDYTTSIDEECLSDKDVRAWSSPIYLNYRASTESSPPSGYE